MDLEIHELAFLMPPLSEEDYEGLKESIAILGQLEPIQLYEGKILDGRHRHQACRELGLKPIAEEWAKDIDPADWIIATHIDRRNLTPGQKAAAAAREWGGPQQAGRPKNHTHEDDSRVGLNRLRQRWHCREENIQRAHAIATRSQTVFDLLWRGKYKTVAEAEDALTGNRLGTSKENEWYTPAIYIEAARKVLGGIDLDPASNPVANETVQAKDFWTKTDDGLNQEWYGRIWLNPPYGRLAGDFAVKLAKEYAEGGITAGICLVNAHCTDTDWFQSMWDGILCFTDHRIDFDASDREKTSSSTHGSVFIYFGPEPEKFAAEFSQFGAVVRRYQ